jgi:glycosyltransferase involved in cell wall biosynthesis
MGEAGRQRARELFSMNACIDAYEALYCEVGAEQHTDYGVLSG